MGRKKPSNPALYNRDCTHPLPLSNQPTRSLLDHGLSTADGKKESPRKRIRLAAPEQFKQAVSATAQKAEPTPADKAILAEEKKRLEDENAILRASIERLQNGVARNAIIISWEIALVQECAKEGQCLGLHYTPRQTLCRYYVMPILLRTGPNLNISDKKYRQHEWKRERTLARYVLELRRLAKETDWTRDPYVIIPEEEWETKSALVAAGTRLQGASGRVEKEQRCGRI
ncbi:MAG: hypothetical protein M1816_004777 [Peltula sp. TS41687]|nr:MAG: hypothetical protein M1816_004777 [Peltula sp. TS41687]